METPPPSSGSRTGGAPYKVLVVDDSAVVRGLVTRYLQEDPELVVSASVGNGRRAVEALAREPVDVIILDIEMPVMDGLTALPELLKVQPGVKVVMASTLTSANAEVSLQAMAAGAADYIAKPSTAGGLSGASEYQRELRAKVKALALARHRRVVGGLSQSGTGGHGPVARPGTVAGAAPGSRLALRPMPTRRPEVIAIGSSTGGPQALFQLLTQLGPVSQPTLITQHMPPTFTALLAEHINRQTGLAAAEARDGEPLVGGRIYVAPGGRHLLAQRGADGRVRLGLSDSPPENYCKPAVDPMLRSLAGAFGSGVLAVILTGMGSDGLKGGEIAVQAGGHIIAQDEATSVVWGMPGAVAKAGLCSAVLPLAGIAPTLRRLVTRSAA